MELSIRVVLLMANMTEGVYSFMQTNNVMRESLKMGWNMEKENTTILKVNCILEIGYKTRNMGRGSTSIRTGIAIMEIFKITWNMEKVELMKKMEVITLDSFFKMTKIKQGSTLKLNKIKSTCKSTIKEHK